MIVKNKILFISGIVLILSGVSLFIYNQLREPDYLAYSEDDFSDSEEIVKVEGLITVKKEVEVNQSEDKSSEESISSKEKEEVDEELEAIEEPVIEEITEEVEEIIEEKVKHFYIISGVFSVEENANIHMDNLKNEGYKNALVIGKVNGLYNVSFGTYNSKEDAEKDLFEIKEKFQSSAWILYI